MSEQSFVLAIDQGTTSSRAILFDSTGTPCHVAQKELPQIYPQSGWVEHDAEQIWQDTLTVCRQVVEQAGIEASDIANRIDSIGITNQRETTVVWDRATGKPIHNAIVWQDRRTSLVCDTLRRNGHGDDVQHRTGLLLDPYFSGTKIAWILDNVDGARAQADKGHLAFGTIDSYLLWRLTGGRVHATDATNASRSLLYNIREGCWDTTLLDLIRVPESLLPEVRDSSGSFGACDAEHFGAAIPITGIAGDQQAATFGQACFAPGMIKSTYGTGCFVLLNTGDTALTSQNRLLTTIAWQIDGKPTYALEGSIFVAGAAVQWLRDGLKLIDHASETESHAERLDDTGGVYLVPAFTGLGAPYWDADARGALLGLTRDTGISEIVRATLEAVCFQTRDLMGAMEADGATIDGLRVDGGMVANNWVMQFLADVLGKPVDRPVVTETTALGAAYLAGLHTGFFGSQADIGRNWQRDKTFLPGMESPRRDALYTGWLSAVERTRSQI